MRGFDYVLGAAVNRSIREWKELATAAIDDGGAVREDRKLNETFIHTKAQKGKSSLVAEVYGVDLNLGATRR